VTHRVEPLDGLFVFLSVIGSFGLVWMALALLIAVRRRAAAAFVLVTVGVFASDLLALLAKLLTSRERPYVRRPEPEPLLGTPLDFSFPSGHAATAFAGAMLLAGLGSRFAVPLFLLATGVAWSRVYVGVHYPLDVIAGALLGVAVAFMLLRWPVTTLRWLAGDRPRSQRRPPPG
jgi:undecaprenyl-diphosphatase